MRPKLLAGSGGFTRLLTINRLQVGNWSTINLMIKCGIALNLSVAIVNFLKSGGNKFFTINFILFLSYCCCITINDAG